MWPPISPDSNHIDSYVWSTVEREINSKPYNIIPSLKTAVVHMMPERDKDNILSAY